MNIKQYSSSIKEVEKLHAWIEELKLGQGPFQFQTSGSTGNPKQVSFTMDQLRISAYQTKKAFNLTSKDLLLCPFSLNYVAGKMMVTRAYFLEADLIFTGPSRNPLLNEDLQATFIALVPLQLEAVLQNPYSLRKLNQAKAIIIGGAPINQVLESKILNLVSAPIYQTYGMTETLTHVAIRNLSGKEHSDWFKALEGVSFQQDENGCLQVKSPVTDSWIKTNDVVDMDGDSFKWLGRIDWVINSGGFKIHPEKIEAAIESLSLAEGDVLVSSIPDSEMGETALALATYECPENGLKSLLQKTLHKYEVPKYWSMVTDIPRLPNGKMDRLSARQLALNAVRNGTIKKVS